MHLPSCPAPPTVPLSRKQKEATSKGLYLTAPQRAALIQLDNFAGVFRRGANQRYGGIAARTKVLLLGGTGAGKTSVARRFATSHGWDFLSQDASGWIPAGAYAAQSRPSTLVAIRDFVRRVPRGLICIDEIDKLLPSANATRESGYSTAIFAEALAFMDQDERLVGHLWSNDDIQKLKDCFFIVAAGAFQSFLREAERKARGSSLGFGTSEGRSADFGQFLSDSEALPDEIASRFAIPIFIGQPSRADFQVAIEHIHEELGVERQRPLEELLAEAIGYVGGVRWLENYVTKILIAHPESVRPVEYDLLPESEDDPPASPRKYDFFAIDTVEHVRRLNEDAFSMRVALAHVVSGLHLAVVDNSLVQSSENEFWQYLNDGGSFWELTCTAIEATNLCTEVSSDISRLEPLLEWQRRAWKGLRDHASNLEKLGLLSTWMKAWDLCSRVTQRQAHLSNQVAMGRYQQ
jgi:hypothetical protein